jgi:hypothetical protein
MMHSTSRSDAVRYRICAGLSTLLFASVAMSQTATPPITNANDNWASHPATSSSTFSAHPSTQASQPKEHFKFKDRSNMGPSSAPPPSANDKSSVMGSDRAWQDGRPPLDCAQTPQDPKCH